MSNAPDRIHITTDIGMVGTGRWTSAGLENAFKQPVFIPSTPAREHADELVDALGEISQVLAWQNFGECRGYSETLGDPAGVLNGSKHLLAKIKEASNE